MKAAFFSAVFYTGSAPDGWPTPADRYSHADARATLDSALAQFRLADEIGFDWVSLAEHHFGPFGLTPNPMVFAGALTQVVKRAKIALLGPTIPILNPVRVAEEFAMLDAMTGGRVIAGMMRGTPNEYVTYNVNPAESRGRFEEALQVIRRAWVEPQPFGWEGRFYQYRTISIWPRPVQVPHPPIYMSGSSPESAEFAARQKVSLGLAVTTLDRAAEAARRFREQAALAGWQPQAEDVLYRLSFHVADSDAEARRDLADSTLRPQRGSPVKANRLLEAAVADTGYYGAAAEDQRSRVLDNYGLEERVQAGQLLIGSPESVVQQIERIAGQLKPGVLDVVSAFQLDDRTMKSIRLFGEKVLPRIRHL
ncbi:MAG: LLM class flavin-dependent oxidoreductase [Rhodospirillaceae bacterium]|nr:LLM class flavin-dependent oxidoreductase [Rhodospirillaceae bacterium]